MALDELSVLCIWVIETGEKMAHYLSNSDVYRYLYVGPNPTKNRKKKKKTIEFRDFLQFLPYLTGL